MRVIKLVIMYDGSAYHGFQRQKNAVNIQSIVEEKLSRITGENILVVGSGRTDSGVHALGQVLSFTCECRIPTENLVRALKGILPLDIVPVHAAEAADDFHARYSAKWKRYCYRISTGKAYNPFLRNYTWQLSDAELNVDLMNAAATKLLGTHDFSLFRSSGSVQSSPIKTIYRAEWRKTDEGLLFVIEGDGFLYHMVRNIVWCLAEIGQGKKSLASFEAEFLKAEKHFKIAPAPPQGLYLDYVGYEKYSLENSEFFLDKHYPHV